MRFGYSIQLPPRLGRWVAGVVFFLVGVLIFLAAPSMAAQGDRTGFVVMRVLGGVFLVFGGLILTAMAGDVVLKFKAPEQRAALQWWVNFGGGMLGAGLFSLPAALAGPAMLVAYLHRPNAFFPPGRSMDVKHNLLMGAVFSVVGLLGMVLMYFVAKGALRQRPGRRRRRA